MTDLASFVQSSPMIDTHEHLLPERQYVDDGPDVLRHIFDSYVVHDLACAGATEEQIKTLLYRRSQSPAERLAAVAAAWKRCRHTGYGEAARIVAKRLFDIDEITPDAVEAAEGRAAELRKPGGRLHVLRDLAGLDHVQIDNFDVPYADAAGPAFFLYDLSWADFASGKIDTSKIGERCGVTVSDLASLRQAIEVIFTHYAPIAIAVKTQHAYQRTLVWKERDDADAAAALDRSLCGEALNVEDRLCLGDWCLARGVERAVEHNLPVKIHTGYYAGTGSMGRAFPMDGIRASHLASLLARYPRARFVLMHTAWPYGDELIALAKQHPNAYLDLCWAWSIAPDATCAFVRRAIHAVPSHKLFAFGGDTGWPGCALAYSVQARHWLTRALQSEVTDGLLTEPQAIALTEDMMLNNQRECFDITGTRAAIERAAATAKDGAGRDGGSGDTPDRSG